MSDTTTPNTAQSATPAAPASATLSAPTVPATSASASPTSATAMPVSLITIQDFANVQLKIATITAAERVEGTTKLLKLQIDLGSEQRQIVAGIAQHYTPEELVGKQICVVANLQPAKLRGIESQGMLLAASDDTTLAILTPLKPIAPGSRVK